MKKSVVIALCLFCFVAAVPVPEDRPKSIELLKIPLKGDKELDILTVGADSGTVRERNKRTIGVLRELFPNLSKVIDNQENAENKASAEGLVDLIRVVRETSANSENSIEPQADQKPAESQSTDVDELSLDGKDDEEDRNKRSGFGSLSSGSSGSSSSAGSGNFLFDIIRLVSGSSATEQTDEEENAAESGDDVEEPKGDGYTEGIPGPVTRLFVLANRGLSNLIQDLILRVAQTSERLVNFKARLITSLI